MNKKYKISGFADEIAQDLNTQTESLTKLDIHYVEMRGVDGNNLIFHSDEKVKGIKNKLDASGISLSAIGSPLGKIGIEEPFEKHFEDFKRAVEIAHKMDTRNIRMFSFYVPEGSAKESELPSLKNAFIKEQVFERIGRFVEYASENDILLLHENEKGIYGEKANECLELMKAFGGDHFKAIFDFANFVQAGQDTLEAYSLLKDYIFYVHVKDAYADNGNVVPAGFGDGNVSTIIHDMLKNGYDGFFSLEPHLFNFTGFAGLERNNKKIGKIPGKALTGFEAFSLAHKALLKIFSEA